MNANEPAYPCAYYESDDALLTPTKGLTKREKFAAMAMQGLMRWQLACTEKELAMKAVACADALLAELENDLRVSYNGGYSE